MKKILSFVLSSFILLISSAQVPMQINYQGIARNSVGNVLPNQPITVRLSIRDGSASGTVVYTETRDLTTNAFGLFYYGIGSPGATSVTGTLGAVSWVTGNKYLQVEIDPKGGTSFTDAGTTQLLSVPYAIYAAGASPTGNAGGSLTGVYPNPTIANGAVTLAMMAPGVIPTTLPPSGPAGGSLTGTYPNPTVANAAIIQSMIGPGVTLPPNGPAGGSLTGTYPNPTIANGVVTQSMIAPGVTLPPSGAASGDLSGNYPGPTVTKIQGRSINNTAPVLNDVLSYNGSSWGPVNLSSISSSNWTLNGTDIYNNNTGNVGIGTNAPSYKLHVTGGNGYFTDTVISKNIRVGSLSTLSGILATGSFVAVAGSSFTGVGLAGNSTTSYGGYFSSNSGSGIYAETFRPDENWAGYFMGNVYSNGAFQGSDRKLKRNITDLSGAMKIINQLKPKIYEFRQEGEFSSLHLPGGQHYGLIAQDLETLMPTLVKETVHQKMFSADQTFNDGEKSKLDKLNDTNVSKDQINFKAINYIELIPIMIKGMQEQQLLIDKQKEKIETLEARLAKLESK